MNIFSSLNTYERPTRKYEPPTKEEIKKNKIEELKQYALGFSFYLLLLLVLGCLWWFIGWGPLGALFFLLLSLFSFGIITPTFAKLSDFFIKWWGEDKGIGCGCIGMAMGPIIGFLIFCSSVPYWDLKEHAAIESSPIVYVTPHGECYHSSRACYTIQGHKIKEISQYKAEKKGKRPCSICYQ